MTQSYYKTGDTHSVSSHPKEPAKTQQILDVPYDCPPFSHVLALES